MDILPPPLQKEFFESERALALFHARGFVKQPPLPAHTAGPRMASRPAGSDWHAGMRFPKTNARKHPQCNQFFELTPMEKRKRSTPCRTAERQQMEKNTGDVWPLPPGQRRQCIRAFTEFAGMSAQEKQDFLK